VVWRCGGSVNCKFRKCRTASKAETTQKISQHKTRSNPCNTDPSGASTNTAPGYLGGELHTLASRGAPCRGYLLQMQSGVMLVTSIGPWGAAKYICKMSPSLCQAHHENISRHESEHPSETNILDLQGATHHYFGRNP
jgi:hypothetical protein